MREARPAPLPVQQQLWYLLEQARTSETKAADPNATDGLQKTVQLGLFDYLRRHHPTLRLPGAVVVARYDDVKDVLARDDDFGVTEIYSERMHRTSGPFILGMERTPDYTREAEWLQSAIRPGDLDRIRRLVRGYIDAALSALPTVEGNWTYFDLVSTLTRRIPVRLIHDYFGVPVADDSQMQRWMRSTFWELFFNLSNNKGVTQAALRASEELNPYLSSVIEARCLEMRQGSTDRSFLSRLIENRADFGEPQFTTFDIRRNIAGVIIGAVDTLNKAVAQLVAELLRRPEAWSQARAAARRGDLTEVSGYAFEALRFDPLGPLLVRVCHRESVIAAETQREIRVAPGTRVFALTQAAMFDPQVFEEPHQFRPDRSYEPALLFGDGQHRCFGERFNRAIIPEILLALLRLPRLERLPGSDGLIRYEGPFPDQLLLRFDRTSS